MAYPFVDVSVPDAANERGADLTALNTAILGLVTSGCIVAVPQWSYYIDVGEGTYYAPDAHKWVYSEDTNQIVQVDMTYDGSGRVATVSPKYTTDGGSNWTLAGYHWLNTYDETTEVLASSVWTVDA
jgi:hypothetical protein